MYLFLNAVSKEGSIILFDDKKTIIEKENLSIVWEESSKLIDFVDNFLKKNSISYNEIENLVVVNWPGSFTWIRAICLVANTLSYIYTNLRLTEFSYFDLYKDYPIVKASSKRDLFVKKSKNNIIEVIKNEDFLNYIKSEQINTIYWEEFAWLEDIKVQKSISYVNLIKETILKDEKQIDAYYIKKPSIS